MPSNIARFFVWGIIAFNFCNNCFSNVCQFRGIGCHTFFFHPRAPLGRALGRVRLFRNAKSGRRACFGFKGFFVWGDGDHSNNESDPFLLCDGWGRGSGKLSNLYGSNFYRERRGTNCPIASGRTNRGLEEKYRPSSVASGCTPRCTFRSVFLFRRSARCGYFHNLSKQTDQFPAPLPQVHTSPPHLFIVPAHAFAGGPQPSQIREPPHMFQARDYVFVEHVGRRVGIFR